MSDHSSDKYLLAVIIPAFKPQYLSEALHSLASQTDKRFHVYVFDDDSPYGLSSICQSFQGILDIFYFRFPCNLGLKSLPSHWNRCIAATTEDWIWLFSDDDIASATCVAEFYSVKCNADSHLFSFRSAIINEDSFITYSPSTVSRLESPLYRLYQRLTHSRISNAIDHIFSRIAFDQVAGFRDLPLAWCVDDIAWFEFALGIPIFNMKSYVYWRLSSQSISGSSSPVLRLQKFDASLLFYDFLEGCVPGSDLSFGFTPREFARASKLFCLNQCISNSDFFEFFGRISFLSRRFDLRPSYVFLLLLGLRLKVAMFQCWVLISASLKTMIW